MSDRPLDVKNVLDAVSRIHDWFAVGLGLGVDEFQLKIIELDYKSRGGTLRCMTELVRYWLKNDPNASWVKLSRVVGQVTREQEEEMRRQEDERRRQEEAERRREEDLRRVEDQLRQLEDIVLLVQEMNEKIKSLEQKLREFENEQRQNQRRQSELLEKVLEDYRKWNREWESNKRRVQNMQEALRSGRHRESPDVQDFLREVNLPEDAKIEVIECYLWKYNLNKVMEQSEQLKSYQQQIKQHQTKLQRSADEIRKHEALFKGHKDELCERLNRLNKLGVKSEELFEFHKQLQKVEDKLKRSQSLLDTCYEAIDECQYQLKTCLNDMRECAASLAVSKQELDRSMDRLRRCIDDLEKNSSELLAHIKSLSVALGGLAAGGAVWGTSIGIGSLFGPVGAVVGALGGWVAASAITAAGVAEANRIEHEIYMKRQELDKTKKELGTCEGVMLECKETVKTAEKELDLLRDLS